MKKCFRYASFLAFASAVLMSGPLYAVDTTPGSTCEDNYQIFINSAEQKDEEAVKKGAAGAIAGTAVALVGGNPIAALVAGGITGGAITYSLSTDSAEAEKMLALIRDLKVGDGFALQSFLNEMAHKIQVSDEDMIETLLEMDRSGALCRTTLLTTDEVMEYVALKFK